MTEISSLRNLITQIKSDGKIDSADRANIIKLKDEILKDKTLSKDELNEVKNLIECQEYKNSNISPSDSGISELFAGLSLAKKENSQVEADFASLQKTNLSAPENLSKEEVEFRTNLAGELNGALKDLGLDTRINNINDDSEFIKALNTIQKKIGLPEKGSFKDPETLIEIARGLDIFVNKNDNSGDKEELINQLNNVSEKIFGPEFKIKGTSDQELANGIKLLQKKLKLPQNGNFTDAKVMQQLDNAITKEANKRVMLANYLNGVLETNLKSGVKLNGINDAELEKGMKILQKAAGLPATGKFDDQKSMEDLDKAFLKRKVLDALGSKLNIKISPGANLADAVKNVQKELGLKETGTFGEADQKQILEEIIRRDGTMNFLNSMLKDKLGSNLKINSISTKDMKAGVAELQKMLGMKSTGNIDPASISMISMKLNSRADHMNYLNKLFFDAGSPARISKFDDQTISGAITQLRKLGYKNIGTGDQVGIQKGFAIDDNIYVKKFIGAYDDIGTARAMAYGAPGTQVIVRNLQGKFNVYEVDESISHGQAIAPSSNNKIKPMVMQFVGDDDSLVDVKENASAWRVLGSDISDFTAECRENLKISAKWVGGQVRYAAEFYGDLKKEDSVLANIAGYVGGGILDGVSKTRESIENAEEFYADQVNHGNKTVGYVGGFLTMFASPVKNATGIADYKIDDDKRAKMIEGLGVDLAVVVAGGAVMKVGGKLLKGAGNLAMKGGKAVGEGLVSLGKRSQTLTSLAQSAVKLANAAEKSAVGQVSKKIVQASTEKIKDGVKFATQKDLAAGDGFVSQQMRRLEKVKNMATMEMSVGAKPGKDAAKSIIKAQQTEYEAAMKTLKKTPGETVKKEAQAISKKYTEQFESMMKEDWKKTLSAKYNGNVPEKALESRMKAFEEMMVKSPREANRYIAKVVLENDEATKALIKEVTAKYGSPLEYLKQAPEKFYDDFGSVLTEHYARENAMAIAKDMMGKTGQKFEEVIDQAFNKSLNDLNLSQFTHNTSNNAIVAVNKSGVLLPGKPDPLNGINFRSYGYENVGYKTRKMTGLGDSFSSTAFQKGGALEATLGKIPGLKDQLKWVDGGITSVVPKNLMKTPVGPVNSIKSVLASSEIKTYSGILNRMPRTMRPSSSEVATMVNGFSYQGTKSAKEVVGIIGVGGTLSVGGVYAYNKPPEYK